MRDPPPCLPRRDLGSDFFDDGHTRKYVPQDTRESLRPPPLWMAINVYRGLCWCGRPHSMWEPRQRRHCCHRHYSVWNCGVRAPWSIYREHLVRAAGRCEACGAEYGYREEMLEVDHIEALALGGSMWDVNNHRVLCKRCHRSKTAGDHRRMVERRRAEKSAARLRDAYGGLTLEDYVKT